MRRDVGGREGDEPRRTCHVHACRRVSRAAVPLRALTGQNDGMLAPGVRREGAAGDARQPTLMPNSLVMGVLISGTLIVASISRLDVRKLRRKCKYSIYPHSATFLKMTAQLALS